MLAWTRGTQWARAAAVMALAVATAGCGQYDRGEATGRIVWVAEHRPMLCPAEMQIGVDLTPNTRVTFALLSAGQEMQARKLLGQRAWIAYDGGVPIMRFCGAVLRVRSLEPLP